MSFQQYKNKKKKLPKLQYGGNVSEFGDDFSDPTNPFFYFNFDYVPQTYYSPDIESRASLLQNKTPVPDQTKLDLSKIKEKLDKDLLPAEKEGIFSEFNRMESELREIISLNPYAFNDPYFIKLYNKVLAFGDSANLQQKIDNKNTAKETSNEAAKNPEGVSYFNGSILGTNSQLGRLLKETNLDNIGAAILDYDPKNNKVGFTNFKVATGNNQKEYSALFNSTGTTSITRGNQTGGFNIIGENGEKNDFTNAGFMIHYAQGYDQQNSSNAVQLNSVKVRLLNSVMNSEDQRDLIANLSRTSGTSEDATYDLISNATKNKVSGKAIGALTSLYTIEQEKQKTIKDLEEKIKRTTDQKVLSELQINLQKAKNSGFVKGSALSSIVEDKELLQILSNENYGDINISLKLLNNGTDNQKRLLVNTPLVQHLRKKYNDDSDKIFSELSQLEKLFDADIKLAVFNHLAETSQTMIQKEISTTDLLKTNSNQTGSIIGGTNMYNRKQESQTSTAAGSMAQGETPLNKALTIDAQTEETKGGIVSALNQLTGLKFEHNKVLFGQTDDGSVELDEPLKNATKTAQKKSDDGTTTVNYLRQDGESNMFILFHDKKSNKNKLYTIEPGQDVEVQNPYANSVAGIGNNKEQKSYAVYNLSQQGTIKVKDPETGEVKELTKDANGRIGVYKQITPEMRNLMSIKVGYNPKNINDTRSQVNEVGEKGGHINPNSKVKNNARFGGKK